MNDTPEHTKATSDTYDTPHPQPKPGELCRRCGEPENGTQATLGVPVYLYPSYPRYDTEPCIVVQVTGRYLGDGWREKVEAVYAKLREVFPQDG